MKPLLGIFLVGGFLLCVYHILQGHFGEAMREGFLLFFGVQ